MPLVKPPLFSKSYRNADQSVLSDQAYLQINGFIDELGGLNFRPGLRLGISTGSREIDGLFYWPDRFLVSVESGFVCFYSTTATEIVRDLISSAPVSFPSGSLVSFATDGTYLFMAAGEKINYVTSAGVVAELADADAPTTVTKIAFIDGYILAIDGTTGKFYWSNIPTTTNWSALDFATAEGAPDDTVSLLVSQRQIYLFGTASTEIWENDGETPFSRVPGGFLEVGCLAKHSVIKLDNDIIWLGHNKYFVKFSGGTVDRVSSPYDKDIANFSTVSDCIAGRLDANGRTYCVFQFPTEGRTLAYDVASEDWSEWGYWDYAAQTWKAFDFSCAAFDVASGKTYVGGKRSRAINLLDPTCRTDALPGSTTAPVKFLRITGDIDYGTSKKKRSESLRFRIRRGDLSDLSSPKLMIRWQDDGKNNWSNIKEIDLGATGDTNIHVSLNRTGMFRSRKYEISATDAVSIVLSNAEEDITILNR